MVDAVPSRAGTDLTVVELQLTRQTAAISVAVKRDGVFIAMA
ncbi:MAG: hypothetical protein ACI8PP_001417 [Candidatus Pseudothioglobus sp.]|jgi:hypothetical protein